MALLFLGVGLVACWLLASFALQWLRGHDRRCVASNAAVGLGSWVTANVGFYLLITTQVDAAWILLAAGLAAYSGWIISPGGVYTVFAPVASVNRGRLGEVRAEIEDNRAPWGRESSKMAGYILGLAGITAIAVLFILRLTSVR